MANVWETGPADLVCGGCLSEAAAVFGRGCRFRSCAASKGIEHCFRCDTFPCADLVKFRNDDMPHHSVVLANLARMREAGLEEDLVAVAIPLVVFLVLIAGEESARQVLGQINELRRILPSAKIVLVRNERDGKIRRSSLI